MIIDEGVPSSVSRSECEALCELARGRCVLELGSWYGRSTIALASVARVLHAVDWHHGDPHSGPSDTLGPLVERLRTHELLDSVVLHVGRNEDVLPLLRDGLFGLVFVDSFHARSAVERDIELAYRLLEPGGVIAFHDYGINLVHNGVPFGVSAAVDAFAARSGRKIEVVGSLAILRFSVDMHPK